MVIFNLYKFELTSDLISFGSTQFSMQVNEQSEVRYLCINFYTISTILYKTIVLLWMYEIWVLFLSSFYEVVMLNLCRYHIWRPTFIMYRIESCVNANIHIVGGFSSVGSSAELMIMLVMSTNLSFSTSLLFVFMCNYH